MKADINQNPATKPLLLCLQFSTLKMLLYATENGNGSIKHCPFAAVLYIYRMSQEEWTKLRESVPYVKVHRYNPKHLYPKLNGYGDNGQRSLKL